VHERQVALCEAVSKIESALTYWPENPYIINKKNLAAKRLADGYRINAMNSLKKLVQSDSQKIVDETKTKSEVIPSVYIYNAAPAEPTSIQWFIVMILMTQTIIMLGFMTGLFFIWSSRRN
jgi:hypothetical protein